MSIGTLPPEVFDSSLVEQATVTFAPLLREYRDRRRLSQSRLASAAGFDHSYVSRLEGKTRMPTRDAVVKLADAMGLEEGERDALLASAGFMPGRIENLFANEPILSEVLGLLQDQSVPAEIRDDVRQQITMVVRMGHRAAVSSVRYSNFRAVEAVAD